MISSSATEVWRFSGEKNDDLHVLVASSPVPVRLQTNETWAQSAQQPPAPAPSLFGSTLAARGDVPPRALCWPRTSSMAIRRWLGQHLPAAAADEAAAMAEAEASRWAGVSLVAKVSPPAARQLQTCGLPLDVPLPLLSEMVSARGQTALRIRTSATVALTHASATAPRSRQQSPCRRRAPTQGRQCARSGALTLRSSGAARAHRSCDAAAGPAAARAVPGGRGLARPRAAWRHLPRGAEKG